MVSTGRLNSQAKPDKVIKAMTGPGRREVALSALMLGMLDRKSVV
jgi:hypothetical protein